MLNENYRIMPFDDASCTVSWTSPWPDGASWLFVNGRHARGPYVTGQAARSIRVPFALADVVKLEVHDFPDESVLPEPVEVEPNTRPLLVWNAVKGAVRYRVYHREFSQAQETLIHERPAAPGVVTYEILCPIRLAGRGGVWHFQRVEAVDVYGNQSTRKAWTYFAADLPPAPSKVEVKPGSAAGLYTISLEV